MKDSKQPDLDKEQCGPCFMIVLVFFILDLFLEDLVFDIHKEQLGPRLELVSELG